MEYDCLTRILHDTVHVSKSVHRIALCVIINYNIKIFNFWWNINYILKTQLHGNL